MFLGVLFVCDPSPPKKLTGVLVLILQIFTPLKFDYNQATVLEIAVSKEEGEEGTIRN